MLPLPTMTTPKDPRPSVLAEAWSIGLVATLRCMLATLRSALKGRAHLLAENARLQEIIDRHQREEQARRLRQTQP